MNNEFDPWNDNNEKQLNKNTDFLLPPSDGMGNNKTINPSIILGYDNIVADSSSNSILGSNNIIAANANNIVINGDNNTVVSGINNVVINGNNIIARQSNVNYNTNVTIDYYNKIETGIDTVLPIGSRTITNQVNAGIDTVLPIGSITVVNKIAADN